MTAGVQSKYAHVHMQHRACTPSLRRERLGWHDSQWKARLVKSRMRKVVHVLGQGILQHAMNCGAPHLG